MARLLYPCQYIYVLALKTMAKVERERNKSPQHHYYISVILGKYILIINYLHSWSITS